MTRDISTSGIFFESEMPHTTGDSIGFSVEFIDGTVNCQGRIVRVETVERRFGIAVELTSYDFQ